MLRFIQITTFALTISSVPALAEMSGTVRIGVLNDMSGVYSDFQGPGSVVAAQLAADDFVKQSKRKVEILSADHQNKPDVGATVARRWIDVDGVDMIIDVPNSAVALAVSDIIKEKNKVFIGSGAGTALLSRGKVLAEYRSLDLRYVVARAHTRAGYAAPGREELVLHNRRLRLGHDLEKQASEEVNAEGGKVLGSVRHPLGTNDFSSFLLQAQASGAQVVALANAGGDSVNTIKQAGDFNIREKQRLVALIFDLQSVPAVGLAAAEGLQAVNAFYWDMNDQTRTWSKRYQERHPKKMMPNHMQASVYLWGVGLPQGHGPGRLSERRPRRCGSNEGNARR